MKTYSSLFVFGCEPRGRSWSIRTCREAALGVPSVSLATNLMRCRSQLPVGRPLTSIHYNIL